MCGFCQTAHKNPRKQACRECGKARSPAAAKNDPKDRPGKAGAKEKPLTCGKQLAKFLTQNGVDLHMVDLKAACPPPMEEPGSKAARQILDQSTEALMAAIAALQSLGMPESTTRPFQ